MKEKKTTVHLFSEKKDVTKIASQLMGLSVVYYNLSSGKQSEAELLKNDVALFYITSLSSAMFDEILDLQKFKNIPQILLIENKNPVVTSKLAKMGFNEIYILPDELFKFGDYLKEKIQNISEQKDEVSTITSYERNYVFRSILGNSPEVEKLIIAARTAAENASVNVLILGETGTGKGMLANAIHNYGNKKDSPFVEVTCSAIPEHLLESELFGHEKGAFTDAKVRKLGLFELADNGTIFLDEIGELSLNLQVKLLRVLEKKIIRRVGGTHDIPITARIISATHRDLNKLIKQNLFRTDLYYRLNVITIELASLRNRKDFIISLIDLFIKEFSENYSKTIKRVDEEALNFLTGYNWPGNIRELRNAFERAVLLCDGGVLTVKHFENIINRQAEEVFSSGKSVFTFPAEIDLDTIQLDVPYSTTDLQRVSLLYIHKLLKKVSGNKSLAARLLGISRPRLDRLLAGEINE
ncbi:MAG: sigma-54 dependent transcriptional regulator [Ignavibacteriaceae bacterium]|jgi:transcriptional regulator with PAS, ATPase and Fis domain